MKSIKISFIFALVSLSIFAFAKSDETEFVFINGGFNESSNYSIHERDLLTFKADLFHGSRIKIFNAGGVDTPVLKIMDDGDYQRDDKGMVVTTPSTVKDADMATKQNISNFFTDLGKKDVPNKVTVVWGDHGVGDGVALWDESLVSASDIHSFYEKLPSSTMIRAIHIHCYAGAAMSGPNSEIPLGDTQKIQSFLDKKYPSNVCGLSLSDSDEIGQYRGWAQDEWHKDLQKKSLSLSELKAKLEADTTFFPSVMLTSDYFLRDLRNSLCKLSSVGESAEKTKTEGSVCRECSANKNMTLAKNVEDLKHTLCEMPSKDSDVFGHFDYVNKLYNELESMKFEVNREFIKTKFPDLYNNVLKSVKEMDAIKQQIAQEKDPKQIDTLVKKLDAVRSDYPTRYHNYLSSVEDDPDFVSFFNKTATPDWIKERQNKFPTLARVVSVNPDYFASKGMKEYLKFIEEGEEKRLAYERAKLVSSANTYRKSITDVLFSDPQLAPLKERYERIVQCENSSLN